MNFAGAARFWRRATQAFLAAALIAPLALALPARADDPPKDKKDETDEKPAEARPYPEGINCFFVPNPRGFSVIDNKHLVIEGSSRKYYLVTLFTRCFDLKTTFSIRLDRMGSQLCGPGDSIITAEDKCDIRYLEEVTSYDEGEAIVEARKAADMD